MTITTLCQIYGCGKPARHLGWCLAHYRRYNKYGDPLAGASAHYKSPEEAFLARSAPRESGCIEWTGSSDTKGYGQLRVDRKLIKAHRYAVERINGPIPSGMVVMHACDNPKCVNIDHLRVGSQKQNVHDMDLKGRRINKHPKGETHKNAKLTDDDVRAIRRDTRRQIDIAATYGVAQTVVSKIKLHQAWRHVK
jgi:hypothetical protein